MSKKKYAIIFYMNIYDSLEKAVDYYVKEGKTRDHRLFEIGQEYKIILSKPTVERVISENE